MSPPARRPTIRDENKANTRRWIIDALVTLVEERGNLDFTVSELSERSNVPLRTLYRYYPKRQDLIDALAAVDDQVAAIELPDNLDGYVDWLTAAWRNLITHEMFIRAQHHGQGGVEVRRARIPFFRAVVSELLEHERPGLPPDRHDDVVDACLLLTSSATMFEMLDVMELDLDRAARIAATAMVTIIRAA